MMTLTAAAGLRGREGWWAVGKYLSLIPQVAGHFHKNGNPELNFGCSCPCFLVSQTQECSNCPLRIKWSIASNLQTPKLTKTKQWWPFIKERVWNDYSVCGQSLLVISQGQLLLPHKPILSTHQLSPQPYTHYCILPRLPSIPWF